MAQKYNKTCLGTELKIHIGFEYPGEDYTLQNLDKFEATFYTDDPDRCQTFVKDIATGTNDFIVENGYYFAPVETTLTGPGLLKMKFTAWIPTYVYGQRDTRRKEIAVCNSNVYVEDIGFNEERD